MTGLREWDACAYHRVSQPQVRFGNAVLASLELRGDEVVVDAGCGTGRLTAELLGRLSTGRAIGVDRSWAMVREAAGHLAGFAGRFAAVQADLVDLPLADASIDLVFSTATFHWISDHDRLFAEMARVLRPGGRLVAQCGGAGNIERVRRWAQEEAGRPEVATHFEGWADAREYATPEVTAARLLAAGLVVDHTGLVPAPTRFDGAAEFAEFMSTVVLRPFLARLREGAARERFTAAVTERAGASDPPWEIDYVRLNLTAHRP